MIRLIAAVDRKMGVAKHGILPWYIPEDEKYFTDQTKLYGGNVLTGGRTFRETYHGPLKERQNFILTRSTDLIEGATVVNNLEKFLSSFTDDLWVAGGSEVFRQVLELNKADEIYLTRIDADFNSDQFFPDFEGFKLEQKSETKEQNGFRFIYEVYIRN